MRSKSTLPGLLETWLVLNYETHVYLSVFKLCMILLYTSGMALRYCPTFVLNLFSVIFLYGINNIKTGVYCHYFVKTDIGRFI